MCNCGNNLTPKWLDSVMSWVFDADCYDHDLNYYYRNGKLMSDFIFLFSMLWTLSILLIKLVVGVLLILPMFFSVLIFGFSSYNRSRNGQ